MIVMSNPRYTEKPKMRIRWFRGYGWGVILPAPYFGNDRDWWEPFDSFEQALAYVRITLSREKR